MLGCLMDLLCIDLYCDTVECSPASASISIFMNSHHPIKSTSIVVGSCVWHKAFIQITFHVPFGCATLTMCTCVLACLCLNTRTKTRVFRWVQGLCVTHLRICWTLEHLDQTLETMGFNMIVFIKIKSILPFCVENCILFVVIISRR